MSQSIKASKSQNIQVSKSQSLKASESQNLEGAEKVHVWLNQAIRLYLGDKFTFLFCITHSSAYNSRRNKDWCPSYLAIYNVEGTSGFQ